MHSLNMSTNKKNRQLLHSRRLARQPQRDTSPELKLRSALHRLGFRFRLHKRLIVGKNFKVDIVLPRYRIAILVDGCFWHSCPQHGTIPRTRSRWWKHKLSENRKRDALHVISLQECNWTVVRIWEHEDSQLAARKIAELIGRSSR